MRYIYFNDLVIVLSAIYMYLFVTSVLVTIALPPYMTYFVFILGTYSAVSPSEYRPYIRLGDLINLFSFACLYIKI